VTKRMTLIAKKDGLSTSDFRNYWAGPHAQLALGMAGITRYVHNRVDKVLWASGGEPVFNVDGVVELSFSDAQAMRVAQASAVGQKYIPADEPIFLKGWTLCVVETEGEPPTEQAVKVLLPFHAQPQARDALWREMSRITGTGCTVVLNWTISTARRERLWAEPNPPTGFICVWFDSVAEAHEAFEPTSELRRVIETNVEGGVAYLIDELPIRCP
jgi:EthD domain